VGAVNLRKIPKLSLSSRGTDVPLFLAFKAFKPYIDKHLGDHGCLPRLDLKSFRKGQQLSFDYDSGQDTGVGL
jgi:hypothetical protein